MTEVLYLKDQDAEGFIKAGMVARIDSQYVAALEAAGAITTDPKKIEAVKTKAAKASQP